MELVKSEMVRWSPQYNDRSTNILDQYMHTNAKKETQD